MGYFDDLNNPDWGESTAAAKVVQSSSTPTPYRAQANYNAQVRARQRNPIDDIVPVWQRKPAAQEAPAEEPAEAPVEKPKRAKVISRRTPINWGNKFNDFVGGLSQEQQTWLKDNGLNDATKLQDYLTNMGFGVGKFGSDGKFGKDSRAAWDKFAASGIMGKNRDQEIYEEKQKEIEPVVDAEDPFGYRTDNHYGDGAALKNMGFSNYAGLQKFAAGNDQFAKDLRQRFGQDVSKWDQAAVEGALGVSGRYRGSRGGDFGDMARSMQQWAAQQNAAYDTKEQASRTDSSGTVYSNSKLAQLFDKAGKSVEANKFKLQTPAMNFNLKQGNVGIATLGNIQTLDPSTMSPREKFAMGIE